MESIFLIRISEESWCYLLCYFALKSDKRQSVIRKLVESERLWPQYSRLLYEMLCYREEDIAFQHKVLSAEEQFRSNPKRLKKAFYELTLEKLRPLPNKLEVLRRVEDIVKWNISLDADECFVLLIYEYLYQEPELSATARFLLSIMKNADNIRADCQEYAKEVLNRFQQQVQEREDSALDSDFAYDE